jgi:hypothetical protein
MPCVIAQMYILHKAGVQSNNLGVVEGCDVALEDLGHQVCSQAELRHACKHQIDRNAVIIYLHLQPSLIVCNKCLQHQMVCNDASSALDSAMPDAGTAALVVCRIQDVYTHTSVKAQRHASCL